MKTYLYLQNIRMEHICVNCNKCQFATNSAIHAIKNNLDTIKKNFGIEERIEEGIEEEIEINKNIKFNECNNYEFLDYDNNVIIKIIESNFITHIDICDHNEISRDLLFKLGQMFFWKKNVYYYRIVNYNYSHDKIFFMKRNYITTKIVFEMRNGYNTVKEYEINEFIDLIERGTIICPMYYPVTSLELDEESEIDLKKILSEHNTSFVLKRLQKRDEIIYIIDTPTLVKPAIK